jgi:hypothetical protein
LELKRFSLRNFACGLGDLCGFALSSSLTAKYAKDFANCAKQTAPVPVSLSAPSPDLQLDIVSRNFGVQEIAG